MHKELQELMRAFKNESFDRETVGLQLNPAGFRALWPQISKAFKHMTA